MFAFSSGAIGDAAAFEIIRKAREDHPVQMAASWPSRIWEAYTINTSGFDFR
jgi:hypothetical protein